MKRRVASLAILTFVVVAQLAASRAASAVQETTTSTTGVTVTEVGRGQKLKLHNYSFEPGGSIGQTVIPEPMLIEPQGGAFIFYIPASAGGVISFRGGEAPFAVDSTNCTLPIKEGEQMCEFDDQPSRTQLPCTDTSTDTSGLILECQVLDTVGILVRPGTTVVLPGPTECMVCKLDADAGDLEVASASPLDEPTWLREVGNVSATPAAMEEATPANSAVVLVDPCSGLIRS